MTTRRELPPGSGRRLAVAGAHYGGDLASRQRAVIEQRIEHLARFRRQKAEPHLFFGPTTDTRLQAGELDKVLHESDLVDTGLQEEPRELDERFLAQIATAIQIVATR